MSEDTPMKEATQKVTWDEFTTAFAVFGGLKGGDYAIVNHSDTPYANPFSRPNGLDAERNRQYSVTQIPEGMTEEKFLRELKTRSILFIGCMDKDAIGPAWDLLAKEDAEENIMTLSIGGGIVQERDDRVAALKTVLTYLSENGNFQTVIPTGHNHSCGLVKAVINSGKTLPEVLGEDPASGKENTAMKSLILNGVKAVNLDVLFSTSGVTVIPMLVSIDRQGGAELDKQFRNISPNTLAYIAPVI